MENGLIFISRVNSVAYYPSVKITFLQKTKPHNKSELQSE